MGWLLMVFGVYGVSKIGMGGITSMSMGVGVSSSIGIGIGIGIGSVLKNGFGILKFAEALS